MLSKVSSFFFIMFIFGISFLISYLFTKYFHKYLKNNEKRGKETIMKYTMGIFLFIFAIPKIFNIPQFVEIFSKYDLLATVFQPYGYIYPFIELSIAFLLLFETNSKKLKNTYYALIILMSLNFISVLKQVVLGNSLTCGCFGSLLEIPLSYVSLFESIIMILMAFYLINLQGKKRVSFNPALQIKYFLKTDLVK